MPEQPAADRRQSHRRHEDELIDWRLSALEHNMTALATRLEDERKARSDALEAERKARETAEERRDDRGSARAAWVVPMIFGGLFSLPAWIILIAHH